VLISGVAPNEALIVVSVSPVRSRAPETVRTTSLPDTENAKVMAAWAEVAVRAIDSNATVDVNFFFMIFAVKGWMECSGISWDLVVGSLFEKGNGGFDDTPANPEALVYGVSRR
jgi:hypothetical protein